MANIIRETNGSYHWDCSIETDYHRRSVKTGLWWILGICAAVFIFFLIAAHGTNAQDEWWIPLLVIGVVLVIALPLFLLWNSAEDPHEQYMMTEEYVKSGYGKSAVFSKFSETKLLVITSKYIELSGPHTVNRIYVPEEDMSFVRNFIVERMPENAEIRYV